MSTLPTVLETVSDLRRASREQRMAGRRVGMVPTMGALHPGHLSLVELARQRADWVVMSVFVNPTQFGPGEDFESYPRDLETDRRLASEAGVDALFHPAAEEVYPSGDSTRVRVSRLTDRLCGPWRPGHFEGVATVVAKLLIACEPDVAVFGRKDYQQWRVIQRMATDLRLGVEVVGAPTVREPDGLAMSSRNRYLSPAQRTAALALPRALEAGEEAVRRGERDPARLEARMREVAEAEPGVEVEYLEVVEARELQPVGTILGETLLAGAIRVGTARLIDNREIEID
jgi:pantoate--beta-alanine ligase